MADPVSTPGTPSAGQRMEFDLRDIREAYNVTLETVEHETRMPPDILRRFEAGKLVGDPNYNEVYLRNLLKSYAQALGISHQEVEKAYVATKAGHYEGSLRALYLEPQGKKAAPESAPPRAGKPAPAVAALAAEPEKPARATPPPAPVRPNEHFPKQRVKSAKAASSSAKPIETSWGLIIAGTLIGIVAIGAILWFLFRDPGPEPEPADQQPVAADTADAGAAAADTVAAAAVPEDTTPAPEFQTPIELTLVAADEPLEEFRVKVDDDPRTPYWLEPGAEQSFTGEDEITVWGEVGLDASGGGEYDGARLRLQGFEWTPADGAIVRIDEERGQALLDSLHRAQQGGAAG